MMGCRDFLSGSYIKLSMSARRLFPGLAAPRTRCGILEISAATGTHVSSSGIPLLKTARPRHSVHIPVTASWILLFPFTPFNLFNEVPCVNAGRAKSDALNDQATEKTAVRGINLSDILEINNQLFDGHRESVTILLHKRHILSGEMAFNCDDRLSVTVCMPDV